MTWPKAIMFNESDNTIKLSLPHQLESPQATSLLLDEEMASRGCYLRCNQLDFLYQCPFITSFAGTVHLC